MANEQVEHRENKNLKSIAKRMTRKVNLLELFFDLIVVVALGGISKNFIHSVSNISENHVGNEYFKIAFLIIEVIIIIEIWKTMLFYSSNYNETRWRIRFETFLLMIPLLLSALSNSIADNEGGFYLGAYAIAGALFILGILFLLMKKKKEQVAVYFFWGIVRTTIGIIFTSLLVYQQQVFIFESKIWWISIVTIYSSVLGILLFLEIGDSLFRIKTTRNTKGFVNKEVKNVLLVERHSILFIVFIGEAFFIIIDAMANQNITLQNLGIFLISIIWIFGLWFIFNDNLNKELFSNITSAMIYILLAPFLVASLLFSSIGIGLWIEGHVVEASYTFLISNIIYIAISQTLMFTFSEKTYGKSKMSILVAITLIIIETIIVIYTGNMWPVLVLSIVSILIYVTAGYFLQKKKDTLSKKTFKNKN